MNEVRSSPLKNWLSTPLLNVLTPSSISGNFSLTSFPQIASNFLARCPFHAADKTRLSKILKGPTNLKALSACVSQRNHCTKGPKKRPGVSTSRPGRTQKRTNRPGQRTLGGRRVPLVLIVVPKCPPEFPRLSCMCVCGREGKRESHPRGWWLRLCCSRFCRHWVLTAGEQPGASSLPGSFPTPALQTPTQLGSAL